MNFVFLVIISCLFSLSGSRSTPYSEDFPEWQPGYFDIHHINTGRGNATYMIMPDGTTMLIDAGDISETHPRTMSPRNSALKPNRNKTAPQWIADYIRQFAPNTKNVILDYAAITHYHDDHFGEWDETRIQSSNGAYKLTGIMAVGDEIPIHVALDRGHTFPIDLKKDQFREKELGDEYHIVQTLDEYWKFIKWHQVNADLKNEALVPGSSSQIKLNYKPAAYPSFVVRNISANGVYWTGYTEHDLDTLFNQGQYPGENPLSLCIKFSYGSFDYFTGGDISGVDAVGESDMNSVESHIAPVIGAVDVATLNHHGNRDSQNSFYVRNLRPRVWIGQAWSSDHPGHDVLRRITSQDLYPGPRDLFTTDMLEANIAVIGDHLRQVYRALHGHIVVRVYPGKYQYEVFVLNDGSEQRELLNRFGPYESR